MIARFLCLVALLMAVPVWGANERAKTDRSTKTHTLLVIDNITGEIRALRVNSDNELLVAAGSGGLGAVDQGDPNADNTKRWHVVWRDSTGAEFAVPANPLAMQLFDGASNPIGVTGSPFFMDIETIAGNAIATNAGNASDGTLRVVIVSDQVAIPVLVSVGQTATEPSVISIGTTPTLIATADANTLEVFIKNMGTATVFLGKSAVATTTGIPILGGTVNDDAKGQGARATHGADIYGIVSSGTVNVRVQKVSK